MFDRVLKLSIACAYFVVLRWLQWWGQAQQPWIGLCYHEVTAAQKAGFLRQLRLVKRYTEPVFLDAPRRMSQRPQVALSFDDGFINLLDNALPALQEQKIPVTLFIPSACLGHAPPWLQGSSHENAQALIMTAAQLQALSAEHILIGAHTAHHADLSRLPVAELDEELQTSKQALETLLQRPVNTLAFPYGRYNEQVLERSKAAGYVRVFAADPLAQNSDFFMGRTTASPDDWMIEFYLKIHGAYQWLPYAIQLKSRLKRRFQ